MARQQSKEQFLAELVARHPGEPEFHQAVQEVITDVWPYIEDKPIYREAAILSRLCEPDRVIMFRVSWEDDAGVVHVNRGYRVQNSNAIGPYKGGLRFHPSVNLSILKFLAFEQTFKNSLTGLPLGGGKGGSDFDPKGKSDREIMRFCQAFMTELLPHIGVHRDVPAGDIGVGAREISYMFGAQKRITNEFLGILTGKGLAYGGSLIRNEATGYGCVYMMQNMLTAHNQDIAGKTAIISGSGNVAIYTAEKLLSLGAKVLTFSDSSGFVYAKEGFNSEQLERLKQLKFVKRERLASVFKVLNCEYFQGEKPWRIPGELVFPSATQNEILKDDAQMLIKNGALALAEGANMPTDPEGISLLQEAGILFSPSKAANAGGVAVSGLEMSQNSIRLRWTREEVDAKLQNIMADIHEQCVRFGQEGKRTNYLKGANIAGFVKVADAMVAFGI